MIPDLDELRAQLADLEKNRDGIPLEQLPALVADLARTQATLLIAASCQPIPHQRESERANDDRMLEVDEAATMLGVKPRWLYRHAAELPFTRRISRKIVRFSRAGIARWLATRRT